ncbi:MAG: hypothetical protein IAF02_13715, partial [Anaerolineae bacterium]|nr:hypothetical protein [Anaerolineae bacterium]
MCRPIFFLLPGNYDVGVSSAFGGYNGRSLRTAFIPQFEMTRREEVDEIIYEAFTN